MRSMFPLNTQWRYTASVLRLQDFAKPYHVLSKGFHVSDYKCCCPACPLHSHCVRTDRDCRQRQRGLQQPFFFDEFSDPDRIRAGTDFYLTGTTMHSMPGLPILRFRDLVNWTFVTFAPDRLDPGPLPPYLAQLDF
jgi:hypothetical protein